MAKGSSFEREICKKLSLWWTYNKRDDVFWRTAGSGAMAKTRSKANKKTFGQYGDIQATDPIGQPLIDMCSIELKRGYSKSSFADVIDKSAKAAVQTFEKFIAQAMEDAFNANSYSWLLITKRDRHETMIFMSLRFYQGCVDMNHNIRRASPMVRFKMKKKSNTTLKIVGIKLDDFLKYIKPSDIKKYYDWVKKHAGREKAI